MKKTLGGDRLGSGSKMQVELHGYERSTHDLGYLWRSTMSAGTLVPFLSEIGLPGDTFDINLSADIKTHPTIGPLFGSYKVQLDVFQCPIRLYQGQLHNNKLGIGLNMAAIKLPQITLTGSPIIPGVPTLDRDNSQINPSCLLSYLGIRGVGTIAVGATNLNLVRNFNAIPLLAYWDIYKNYYANKQEEVGAVIHTGNEALVETVDQISFNAVVIPQTTPGPYQVTSNVPVSITYTGAPPILNQIMLNVTTRWGVGQMSIANITQNMVDDGAGTIDGYANISNTGYIWINYWDYIAQTQTPIIAPRVQMFDLDKIDDMREAILVHTIEALPFIVNDADLQPYSYLLDIPEGGTPSYINTQEGLGLKTYQSDLFNNWLQTEWIDGPGGISEITAISTAGDSFTLDTLNLSKKVYDMLNRIAVSGGSYDDWLDAVYTHDRYQRAETPMYMGGLIKELVFQEVVSNAEATGEQGAQPLGSLAGKGVMGKKHKGGQITIKVDEPSWIMGIVSLTPRIDYSQGNKWDTHLATMDDFHKPALDEIGFQELITEQMAWWSSNKPIDQPWVTRSAGKQPAWINYMTNVNQTRGNFAIGTDSLVGEMFMTLNRRYEPSGNTIADLTTYIDPVKFNHIFAQTAIDAQNFWAQIAVDITARRKMSAKIMPNL